MAADFFRIDRGLVVDELAQITARAGTPSTPDEVAAKIGSLFLQTDAASDSLNVWFKYQDVNGTIDDWAQLASKPYADLNGGGGAGHLKLYSENPSSPTQALAVGTNSVAIGNAAQANAVHSLAIGEQSLARIHGSVVIASGRFGTQGDAQVGKYLVRGITPSAAPAELLIDGNGGINRVVLPDNSTWTFKATVTAHETSGTDRAGFELRGVIYRNSGASTTAIQGAVSTQIIGRSQPSWNVSIVPDTTYGSLKVMVTGQTGKIIRWLAHIETVEVTN
jgi:hypothetical protein